MKKLLLAFALLLAPSLAFAQCSGVFPNNTVCGNATGASNTPRATPSISFPANLTVGTSTITGGSNGRLLYDNAGVLGEYTALIQLSSNTTFYTNSATGNDNNACSLAAPCLTLQGTYDRVQATYFMTYPITVTFNVTGTFAAGVVAIGPIPGQRSNLQVVWDLQAATVNGGNTQYGTFGAYNSAQYQVTSTGASTITANGAAGVCVGAGDKGLIGLGSNLTLSGCGASGLYTGNAGAIHGSNITFAGNSNQAMFCSAPGVIELLNGTGTFSGTPTYVNGAITSFPGCLTGVESQSWAGTFIGPEVTANGGWIYGTHALPGSTAPVLKNGGIYQIVDRGLPGITDQIRASGNATPPTPLADTHIQVTGANASDSRVEMETYGGTNYINVRRSNGTSAAPTGLLVNESIGIIGFSGRDSAGNRSDPQASIIGTAAGNWSGTSRPTEVDIYTTPTGSTTQVTRARIWSDGGVTIPPGVTGGSTGSGTLNASGLSINGTAVTAAGITALTGDVTATGPGSVAATIANNAVTLAKLATQATNTVLSNATSGTAVPTAIAMPSCSASTSALKWTTNTGFGCTTFGTVVTYNTGTSGANVPLLNGANTWSADPTFSTNQATFQRASNPFNFVTWRTTNDGNTSIADFAHYGQNSSNAQTLFATWGPGISSNTAAAESAYFQFNTIISGTNAERMRLTSGLAIGNTANPGSGAILLKPQTYASLTACSSTISGAMATVNDSNTVTWGANVAGGSTNTIMAFCNGTNWTVAAK